MKTKIVVVLGPTASGKSAIAVLLAKHFNGEVISADSRQVYKELNLGTGKITKREMHGIPHYLLDVANPKMQFSVAKYKKLGEKVLNSIVSENKIPIICGGTGLYIDTLLGTISLPEVPPNQKLRKILASKSAPELFTMLQKLDPDRAKNIDRHNKVRLVRAIEIAKAIGKAPKTWRKKTSYNVLYIGLKPKDLETRIKKRLADRIKNGMISEVRSLHKTGLTWKRMEALGLEYRYVSRYLCGLLSKEKMLDELTNEIIRYSKRQMTWFKLNKNIVWFNSNSKNTKKINLLVKRFIGKKP